MWGESVLRLLNMMYKKQEAKVGKNIINRKYKQKQLECFFTLRQEKKVCKLAKSLYGLK